MKMELEGWKKAGKNDIFFKKKIHII
jgi:hypothetical protein